MKLYGKTIGGIQVLVIVNVKTGEWRAISLNVLKRNRRR